MTSRPPPDNATPPEPKPKPRHDLNLNPNHHDDDDRDDVDDAFRLAFGIPSPPSALASAVVEMVVETVVETVMSPAHPPKAPAIPSSRPWHRLQGVAIGAAAAAAIALALPSAPPAPPTPHGVVADPAVATGTALTALTALTIDERQTINVPGAILVAEAGTVLAFGPDRVVVDTGEVFFRVDPRDARAPLVVSTPAGDVTVTGTCFRVVAGSAHNQGDMMASIAGGSDRRGHLVSGGVGVVLGAGFMALVTTVTVDEGSVLIRNQHGEVTVPAGQTGTLRDDGPPTTSAHAGDATKQTVADAKLARVLASLKAADGAEAGDIQALVKENQRLRGVVSRQDEELALLDLERTHNQGTPRTFPEDLPPRFTGDPLRTALVDAFSQAGLKGDVEAVDCTEYPCIIWGRLAGNTRDMGTSLEGTDAFAPYADDGILVSGFGTGEGPETFALTVLPKTDEATPQDESLRTRLRHRTREGFEAFRKEMEAKNNTNKNPGDQPNNKD